jgi:hypothetical protein
VPPPDLEQLIEQSRYPGRFEPEHEVIGDWLRARGSLYDRIEFNVRLGAGVTPPPELVEPYATNARELSQKRADIIAWAGDGVLIIEAKGRATSNALGQLQAYRALWQLERPTVPVLGLQVICRRIGADDLVAMTANGVDVYVYGRPDPTT